MRAEDFRNAFFTVNVCKEGADSNGQTLSVFCGYVGIDFRNHCSLCMTGVTLDALDIAAANLQLHAGAAVTEAVKDNLRKAHHA